MKYSIICLFFLAFVSCKQSDVKENNEGFAEETETIAAVANTNFYGQAFDISSPQSADLAFEKYNTLKPGDTINLVFQSKVNSVCSKKGCWMRLEMPEATESFVKFKDYGFFVPKDIAESEAIVHGIAFVTETSVEDLKHFAEDAGKSEEEIAAITKPEVTYGFTADGVYLIQ